jgi:hypothetical protein
MDTLQVLQTVDAVSLPDTTGTGFSIWFWVAVAEFLFIIILLWLLSVKKSNLKSGFGGLKKSDLQDGETAASVENLLNSIAKSAMLYKELSRKCHPDKFINTPLEETAQELFKEISKNKRNYEKLTMLKKKAIEELNINF